VDHKAILHRYLQTGREVLLWKLDGLSDYDVRRPVTTSGTNLLGIVKHVASVEIDYFTRVFDRPCPVNLPWFAPDAPTNSDMWATPQESRDFIVSLYHTSWRVSDSTINQLDLDARGHVPWWREDRRNVTLQQILVHMIAETHRHAGHADVVREFIDGVLGWKDDALNLPPFDAAHWHRHVQEIEQAARSFRVTTSDS
jgi:uncharacterized damage-inducible protein DinB